MQQFVKEENRMVLEMTAERKIILNNTYKFPCKVAFLLIKDQDGSVNILSTKVETTSKLENVKLGHISPGTWTMVGSAILGVNEFKDADEYLKEHNRLHTMWEFVLRKGGEIDGI